MFALHVFLQVRQIISGHISNFQMESIRDMNLVQLEYEQIPMVVAKARRHLQAVEYHRFNSLQIICALSTLHQQLHGNHRGGRMVGGPLWARTWSSGEGRGVASTPYALMEGATQYPTFVRCPSKAPWSLYDNKFPRFV